MANVWTEDNWQVHFRDTMRGGKLLNNWRMAQIHAQEAPDRVLELEEWGALFDRTKDGRILQRDFGGHRYARLAHVGDRTGLEMIRTLQQHAVARGIDVYMECTIQRLLKDGDRIAGAVGYWRESGRFVVFKAKSVVLATGGIGKIYKITSNSWEYTGDGITLAFDAGADLIDMEMVQFHPTGMVWPPSVRGILVTEGVRGDGGTLKNAPGERFMFNYIPDFFRAETADTEEEADAWYEDKTKRRTPDLLPRDEVARAINAEVKAGRGTEHGGVFLDIASRRPADYIRKRLPSMYHQFHELADVDITKQPMEVGPTCHYMMGGVRVDADTTATACPACLPPARSRLDCTARIDSAATRSRICSCLAGAPASSLPDTRLRYRGQPALDTEEVEQAASEMLAPFDDKHAGGENPYAIQADLEDCMQDLVGIIREESELQQAAGAHRTSCASVRTRVRVEGNRHFNPGWHLALDLYSMLSVSEAVTLSALARKESRGGHTRSDYPDTDPHLGQVNLVTCRSGDETILNEEPLPAMPADLKDLFEDKAATSSNA